MGNNDGKITLRNTDKNLLKARNSSHKNYIEKRNSSELIRDEEIENDNNCLTNNMNPQLSATSQKYIHYLNYLYKNNFVSLNYEHLCAFLIQYRWRRFFIKKVKEKKKGIIDIIYSSMPSDPNIEMHQQQTFDLMDAKKYPYRCYDVLSYKNLIPIIKQNFSNRKFPYIFINGYYIGSFSELQEMEDNKMIWKIIKGEYKNLCLMCHVPRNSMEIDTCPYCFKSYTYFAQIGEIFDIYGNR